MLDSPEGVCAGQVQFEHPATSVLFSKRLELGLRRGVVIGDVGAGVGPEDAQVDQELGDRLAGHREPRSAWITPGATPTPAMVAAMNASASSADSPGATSHPGAYRLEMSKTTYRS
jgi:hypothetical protein